MKKASKIIMLVFVILSFLGVAASITMFDYFVINKSGMAWNTYMMDVIFNGAFVPIFQMFADIQITKFWLPLSVGADVVISGLMVIFLTIRAIRTHHWFVLPYIIVIMGAASSLFIAILLYVPETFAQGGAEMVKALFPKEKYFKDIVGFVNYGTTLIGYSMLMSYMKKERR